MEQTPERPARTGDITDAKSRLSNLLPLFRDRTTEHHDGKAVESPFEQDPQITEAPESAGRLVDPQPVAMSDRSAIGEPPVEIKIFASRHVILISTDRPKVVAPDNLALPATHPESDEIEQTDVPVEEAVKDIRPYLKEDGGDMNIVDISNDGVVQVEFVGSCAGCNMNNQTFKNGVEDAILRQVPEIKKVETVNFELNV